MRKLVTLARLKLFLKGVAMGAADVIPGVSGGTIALITGIYGTLITSLTQLNFSKLKALLGLTMNGEQRVAATKEILSLNWGFFIPLGMGIVFSILVLSKGMVAIMDTYPALTYSFFFGLILISVKYPYQEMNKSLVNHLILLVFAVFAFGFFSLKSNVALDPTNGFNVFFGGAVAVCALILPGISGSTFLVIMGLYRPILEALHARDITTVAIFVSGMIIGILTFIRGLDWCLRQHRSFTMAALSGLMLGSLKKVWPYESTLDVSNPIWQLGVCAGLGVFLIFALDMAAKKSGAPSARP